MSNETPREPVAGAADGYALDDAIRAVMHEARMTYHIASCVRILYRQHLYVSTATIRRRLEKMEKAGEVSRVFSPYKTQIAWKHNAIGEATPPEPR